jgi:hypothetical protein
MTEWFGERLWVKHGGSMKYGSVELEYNPVFIFRKPAESNL